MKNVERLQQLGERGLYLLLEITCRMAYESASYKVGPPKVFHFNREHWRHWLEEEVDETDEVWQFMLRNY